MNEDLINDMIAVVWPYLDKAANDGKDEVWDTKITAAKQALRDAFDSAMDSWSPE